MTPRYVVSSTCSVICAPGTQAATLRGSLRNPQTFSAGSLTANFFSIVSAIPLTRNAFFFKDRPYLPRCDRHVDVSHAQVRKRVYHGIHKRGRRAHVR